MNFGQLKEPIQNGRGFVPTNKAGPFLVKRTIRHTPGADVLCFWMAFPLHTGARSTMGMRSLCPITLRLAKSDRPMDRAASELSVKTNLHGCSLPTKKKVLFLGNAIANRSHEGNRP